jgi:hypothetical protein
MVTGGFQMRRKTKRFVVQRLGSILVCLILVLMAAGCSVKYGTMPLTDELESSLRPQLDSKAEVLKVLGPPRGYGMVRMSNLPNSPHSIWFYEYITASGITGKITLKMLLVFFDQEKYVGHLWFSSFEKLK